MNTLLIQKRKHPASTDARNMLGKCPKFDDNHSWLSMSLHNQTAYNHNLATEQQDVPAFHEGQFDHAIESAFNNNHSRLFMSQQNHSVRSNHLAGPQKDYVGFQGGQFKVATFSKGKLESVLQATQSDNINNNRSSSSSTLTPIHSTKSTASSAHLNDCAHRQIFLRRGGYTNSPGNKAATNFICGNFSALYKLSSTWRKKHLVVAVYKTLIIYGFTFVVVNQDGITEEVDDSLAMEYVLRKLREGEITPEERRQKRARYKANHQSSMRS